MNEFEYRAYPAAGVERQRHTSPLSAFVTTGIIAILLGFVTGNWLASLALVVLWAIWWGVPNDDDLHVLAFALIFQWVQVTIGIYYFLVTGRQATAMYSSNYRPMVLIGLGCVTSLVIGLRIGRWLLHPADASGRAWERRPMDLPTSLGLLFVVYLVSLVLEGTISQVAFDYPALTQAILVLRYVHLGTLFLILRRISRPRLHWLPFGLLLGVEVVLGLTGFFAGFREPLVIAAVVLAGVFDLRKVQHWLTAIAIGTALAGISLLWISVRVQYRAEFANPQMAASRAERFDRVFALSSQWLQSDQSEFMLDADQLVDRIWAIYFPALAVARVPAVLPHTGGSILEGAVMHALEPRVFFPDKAAVQSDSNMVRRYTGLPVAGAEQGTTIAFGYAAEGYLDFGVPWMFLPIVLWGVFLGAAYAWLLRTIRHRELAVATVTVIFWLSLYLFERSWVQTIGFAGTMLIYFGGAAVLADRYFLARLARLDPIVGRDADRWSFHSRGPA